MWDSVEMASRNTTIKTENFMGFQKAGRSRKLQRVDELLLTLCKCRHNFPDEDLASRLDIHQTTLARIFASWMEAMEASFAEVPLSPDKATIQQHMPFSFMQLYPATSAIIDAAEIAIEQPKN